jgi:hypothetical protein
MWTDVEGADGYLNFQTHVVIAENAEQALILRSSAERCVSKDGTFQYGARSRTNAAHFPG